jgi:small-conductance mechanosensitive channel
VSSTEQRERINFMTSEEGLIADPEPIVLLKRFDSYGAVYELRAYTNTPNEFLKIQSVLEEIYTRIIPNAWARFDSSPSTVKY